MFEFQRKSFQRFETKFNLIENLPKLPQFSTENTFWSKSRPQFLNKSNKSDSRSPFLECDFDEDLYDSPEKLYLVPRPVIIAKEQKKEIEKLSSEISGLKEIFRDISTFVELDGENLSLLENTIANVESNVSSGVKTLTKAANSSHSVVIPATLAIGGALLGPGAMLLLGVKSGIAALTISGSGAVLGSLFGNKIHKSTESSVQDEFKNKLVKIGNKEDFEEALPL